jgi:hypothetical protein
MKESQNMPVWLSKFFFGSEQSFQWRVKAAATLNKRV